MPWGSWGLNSSHNTTLMNLSWLYSHCESSPTPNSADECWTVTTDLGRYSASTGSLTPTTHILLHYLEPQSCCGFKSHCGPFASNLQQVANLQCAQVNSAFYPSPDGKQVVAYELRGEGLEWLILAVVCLCAAPRVQLFTSAGNGWPHNAPQYH